MKKFVSILLTCVLVLSLMTGYAADEEFDYSEIMVGFEFDGGNPMRDMYNHFNEFKVEDGNMVLKYERQNPYFYTNTSFRVDGDKVDTMEVRMCSTELPISYFKVYFLTSTDQTWNETKTFYITDIPASNEMGIYTVDFSIGRFAERVRGKIITSLRIDLYANSANANEIYIDYIRFCSTADSVEENASMVKYDFTKNNPEHGWDIANNAQNVYISEGVMGGDAADTVNVETCAELAYDAKEIIGINIKYKNETSNTTAKLYYKTTGQADYTEDNSVEFDITPNDTEYSSYFIDTSSIASWRDSITGLRFALPGGGSFAIDEIILYKYPAEITVENGDVVVNGTLEGYEYMPVYVTVTDTRDNSKLIDNEEFFAGAGGALNFNFTGEDSGEVVPYKITIETIDGTSFSKIYPFIGPNFETTFITNINAEKADADAEDLYALVKNNYNYVENGTSNYLDIFTYEDNYADYFAEALVNSDDFTTLDALGERIDECIILSWILNNDEAHSADTESILETYEESEDGKFFKALDPQVKAQCLTATKAKKPYSYDDFYASLTEQSHLYTVSVATGYEPIMEIVETYAEEIGIDRATVNSLANKQLVYLNMVGCSGEGVLSSYAQLKAAFETANNTVNPPQSSSGSTGRPVVGGGSRPGSSGGSSSSGGGIYSSNKPVSNSVVSDATYMYPKDEVNVEKESAFTDMEGYEWALEGVENLRLAGIINGRGDGRFEPQGFVTREEFVKMFILATGEKANIELTFKDVEAGAWYEEYIKTAVASGYITGISADEFGVGENITRQDVCVIAARVLATELSDKGETWEMTFADTESISDYAKDAVKILNNVGLVKGSDGYFRPLDCLTRAEAAVMIDRMMKYSDTI